MFITMKEIKYNIVGDIFSHIENSIKVDCFDLLNDISDIHNMGENVGNAGNHNGAIMCYNEIEPYAADMVDIISGIIEDVRKLKPAIAVYDDKGNISKWVKLLNKQKERANNIRKCNRDKVAECKSAQSPKFIGFITSVLYVIDEIEAFISDIMETE